MNSIDPRPTSRDPRNPATDANDLRASGSSRDERKTRVGMGRSAGVMIIAAIALAGIVAAGFSFGWSGWLTATLGGISILFLLPCLVMCVGIIWMVVRGR